MVVRETPSLADSVEELLVSEGYRVRRVANAREGSEFLRTGRGRQVRATVMVCNEPVCRGFDTMTQATSGPPLIVLGWRGSPLAGQDRSNVVLLPLPISAEALLSNLRTLAGSPVAPAVMAR